MPKFKFSVEEVMLRKCRVRSSASLVVEAPSEEAARQFVARELRDDPYYRFCFYDGDEDCVDNQTVEGPEVVDCSPTDDEPDVACDEHGDTLE